MPAREQVVVQKTATNPQLHGASTYLDLANPNTVTGGGTLQVQSSNGMVQRSLVLFDLSILPNAGVKSALLTLHVQTPPLGIRTYGAYFVNSLWNSGASTGATWNTRLSGVNGTAAWGAAGGDIPGAATNTQGVNLLSTSVTFDITPDVQSWYNSSPNYGTLIRDQTENGALFQTIFSSFSNATPANRPSLTLTYLQNVQNLTTTAVSSRSIGLSWVYPTPITGATVLEAYTGVLILRRAGKPVDKGSIPTDGTDPVLCSTVGTGTVIFLNAASATSFTDNAANDTCGAPVDGTTYYYKVFARDTAGNWTSNGAGMAAPRDGGSTFTAEICATSGAAGSTFGCSWMVGTHTTTLAAPGLTPSTDVFLGGSINLMFGVNPVTGNRLYPPIALGGPIAGRPPVIDSTDSSIGNRVAYVADADNFVYALDAATGQFLWLTNPNGAATNSFQAAAAVVVKKFATASYTQTNDLVVVGTNAIGTTTGNSILAMDGNSGALKWSVVGNTGSIPKMDIISATPLYDYKHNFIWVTSRSAGGVGQPSLWQINPNNTGSLVGSFALGDIDSGATLTPQSDVLFVGNNAGTLYAINPTTGATLASYPQADGAIRGFPITAYFVSPYLVIFSTNTKVQAVKFDAGSNTFTASWSTAVASPSAPVALQFIYVGDNGGKIHQLDVATGTDLKDCPVSTGYPAIISDPSIDVVLGRVIVSTTANDQRAYSYPIPF